MLLKLQDISPYQGDGKEHFRKKESKIHQKVIPTLQSFLRSTLVT